MKTVVINRAKWGTKALVRHKDGKRCCLGFCAISYGVKPDKCVGMELPDKLELNDQKKLPKWLLMGHGDVTDAASINDDAYLTWEEKEEFLKPLFLKRKIKLVFRGKMKE